VGGELSKDSQTGHERISAKLVCYLIMPLRGWTLRRKVAPDRMICLIVSVSEVISIFVRKKNARLITPEAFSQA
jgi:hypothetical protein